MHFALALLASLRDLDTPEDPDALAESDLPLNLRRRLGLSSVVVDQIRRYEQHKGDVSAVEIASLFELIGRRPDATEVFIDAGRRIAREEMGAKPRKLTLAVMPTGLRKRRAWTRVRKIARRLSPNSAVRVEQKNGQLVIECGLPAQAVEGGVGCAVLEGAIDALLQRYRTGETIVDRAACEGSDCTWTLGLATATEDSGDDHAHGNGADAHGSENGR